MKPVIGSFLQVILQASSRGIVDHRLKKPLTADNLGGAEGMENIV